MNRNNNMHTQRFKITKPNKDDSPTRKKDTKNAPLAKSASMSSLIIWNITKALELNPCMDLKGSIRAAKQRLDSEARDLSTVSSQHPEQQHLVCALLAWQQLGHNDADSLYRFVEPTTIEMSCAEKCVDKKNLGEKSNGGIRESLKSTNIHRGAGIRKVFGIKPSTAGSFGSHTSGPVVKLPQETKLVMRFENQGCHRQVSKNSPKRPEKDTMSKIDAACCLDSECAERLAELDAATNELRARAGQLAQRDAERVQLLERAEAAWRDLESGYLKRLQLAEEREEDISRQIQKMMDERNEFKINCNKLVTDLKERGDIVESMRGNLSSVEKDICEKACMKLKLSEEAAKGEAALAEEQCKAAQYERDLLFKEEQTRRKLMTMENEVDSARALTCEAERAMRAELSALREQIAEVSKELLQVDEANVRVKEENEQLRQEKKEMVADLEGCKVLCENKMKGRLNDLAKKKEKLKGLKEQVLECRCQLPVNETVEVKRTPSLAAMCQCAPEDKLLESCSCTSLRGRLLSNLLADLFGGLQAELGGSGPQMPCQLLKCLDDKHNWDRASAVKTNLRNFFSKLLMGELDIAIATSIENYHAKWVGESCADVAKLTPGPEDDVRQGWEQRALEKRAQRMATQLAEQLFQERAEQLALKAKEIVTTGPPPCECSPCNHTDAAAFPCLIPPNSPFNRGNLASSRQTGDTTPALWKRTIQDVTQLRLQIEDLKKDSIKKEDLKQMEEKIFKIVKEPWVMENEDSSLVYNLPGDTTKKEPRNIKNGHTRDDSPRSIIPNKVKRKNVDTNNFSRKTSIYEKPTKQSKKHLHGQSYAVNLCLCGSQKNSKQLQNSHLSNDGKSQTWKQKSFKEILPQTSVAKHVKPINVNLPAPELKESSRDTPGPCGKDCKCFHNVPSTTSIDKLLDTLAKWKCDLTETEDMKNIKSSLSEYSKTAIKESMRFSNHNDSKINLSLSNASDKDQVTESDIRKEIHVETPKQQHQKQIRESILNTESEYMGAVNLDKSNENCKCIPNIELVLNNNLENTSENAGFKCINTTACECRIYQEMQKDHKRSQTDEPFKVQLHANQCQLVQTKDIPELMKKNVSETCTQVKSLNDMNRKSDMNDLPQKTELFANNCEYYIKFLGVTLDDLSNKKMKRTIKDNPDDVSNSKDVEHRRRVSNMPSSFEPKLKANCEGNNQTGCNDGAKCECNAKLEEFKGFMANFFTHKANTRNKDEALDSQSFKSNDNKMESCVCCNTYNMDDSKELEVNAFHLLEDHLKGKLEEFKSFSCKSSCIPPEEEGKLFSAILQRVKQVISDCANEMKCACPAGMPNNGSWNRAYGLLQEYLKIKIKRVQCLCILDDNKEVVLPDILDKVCTLIENDFQRLKDICKCQNNTDIHKKTVRIEDVLTKEFPEKDTNIEQIMYDKEIQNCYVVPKVSKQNSNKSMILTEDTSFQVLPYFGMEAKSCDAMEMYCKNAQTTETDYIDTDTKSNGVIFNTCDCCYNTGHVDFLKHPDGFGNKEVLVNRQADEMVETHDIAQVDVDQGLSKALVTGKINSTKPIPHLERRDTNENENKHTVLDENVEAPRPSYIGYTVDCCCDGYLGSCVCMKSVVNANHDKIDSLWKGFLDIKTNDQNYSYIMNGTQKKCNDTGVNCPPIKNVETRVELNSSELNYKITTRDTEVNAKAGDGMVLKYSNDNLDSVNATANTFDENMSLGTVCSYNENVLEWYEYPAPMTSARSNAAKLANSIYYPGQPIDSFKYGPLNVIDTLNPRQTCDCDCDKVPICHVKMLVENIEKNLMESKCTCDSLISKACPVHSKKY
ncbi:uncharacterized protein LOC111358254 isoform X2 [Spodoptera litura]|uniref:Uncharacterized protein LOC111358254 isoform X2 n=1 Tax=Spodoptera litura TaxID=69820 RepID=A0A9J7EDL0_SPOLT|nr:uncharacterized protein LOC111358254 isoform X2 [Spodoptera litura]